MVDKIDIRKLFHPLLIIIVLSIAGSHPAFAQNKQVKELLSELKIERLAEGTAPDFRLVTLEGDTVSLKTCAGKILILHFWATWCKPCLREMPQLQVLNQQVAGLPVNFLGVSIDEESDLQRVPVMVKKLVVHFPIALAISGSIPDSYWTWGIPVTYLIGRDGKFIGRAQGSRNWNDPKMIELLQLLSEDS